MDAVDIKWINPKEQLPEHICQTVVLVKEYGDLVTRFALYYPCDKFFQIEGYSLSNVTHSNVDQILGYVVLPKTEEFYESKN